MKLQYAVKVERRLRNLSDHDEVNLTIIDAIDANIARSAMVNLSALNHLRPSKNFSMNPKAS